MKKKWSILAGVAAMAAGAGLAAGLVTAAPGSGIVAAAAGAMFAVGMAVFTLLDRSPDTMVLRFGAYFGTWLVCGAGAWVQITESAVLWGLLRFQDRALDAVYESEAEFFAIFFPACGFVVLGLLWLETIRGSLKEMRREKGRKQARSELYGKAKFLERRYVKSLTRRQGILLGESPDGLVAYPLEGSAISFAPPRVGKGATIAMNFLSPDKRGWQGSTVVFDPRGELFPIVARRRRELGRRPILLDPFGVVAAHRRLEGGGLHLPVWESDSYNPLDFVREGEEAVRDIGVLVDALMERPKSDGGNAKHFYESARSLISGYLSWVRFKVPERERNLQKVYELLAMGTDDREQFFAEVEATERFCGGLMHMAMERSRRVGDEEGGSNFTTVANQLSFLNYPEVIGQTGTSSFDPLDLAAGDMDLFVVVPDDLIDLVKGWLRMWITIPYAASARRALQKDMLIVVDEMPRIGYLKPLMDAYNLAAGRGVHIWSLAQTYSALEESWGADAARTLVDLAELVQVLGFPRMDVGGAERLSKAIGTSTFEDRSESRSGQVSGSGLLAESRTTVQESHSVVREQLVTPDDLMTMRPDEQFVIASPKDMPRDALRLKHARYWELDGIRDLADPNPYVIRKERAALPEAA